MGKNKVSKTQGVEWLYLSMSSFNGSGYANKTDGETYATSYVQYKMWKKLPTHAQVALNNWDEAIQFGNQLCEAKDGHRPSDKNYKKFIDFCLGNKNITTPNTYKLF